MSDYDPVAAYAEDEAKWWAEVLSDPAVAPQICFLLGVLCARDPAWKGHWERRADS